MTAIRLMNVLPGKYLQIGTSFTKFTFRTSFTRDNRLATFCYHEHLSLHRHNSTYRNSKLRGKTPLTKVGVKEQLCIPFRKIVQSVIHRNFDWLDYHFVGEGRMARIVTKVNYSV